jgi:glycosyltransferase involved in cell wall biosynthesis
LKISIITVAYNSNKTIEDTIKSVLDQTYSDIEYILVDGGSSDNTLNIIKEYEGKFIASKKSYKWISEKDNGIYDAINKGISMASGDIVGILNSDDYFYDNNVVSDIHTVFVNNDIDCLYGNLIYIHPFTGKVHRRWKSNEFVEGSFQRSWTPAHPTFYCLKSVYDKHGLYKTTYKIAADVELMYRFLQKKHVRSYYYNRNFVKMRQGGVSSRGLKSTVIITKEVMRAFRENGDCLNVFSYLFYKFLKIRERIMM